MSYLNAVTIVGFVGADPEQRQARNNGSKFTVLSVAAQRSWRELRLMQPGVGMHAFRRGRISHLVYSGVSRQVIRDWCGHSSGKMVDHYTKKLRQHHAPEMAKVRPLLDSVDEGGEWHESASCCRLELYLPVPR
jgi:integrase